MEDYKKGDVWFRLIELEFSGVVLIYIIGSLRRCKRYWDFLGRGEWVSLKCSLEFKSVLLVLEVCIFCY